ncbi:MAG: hypothetical protein ACOYL5_05885 [Phototrophicaceae bacterium]|jgi:hypothetical protein
MPRFIPFILMAVLITACGTSNAGVTPITPLPEATQLVQSTNPTQAIPTATLAQAIEQPIRLTATPRALDLPQGSAQQIAQATDAVIQLTPRQRLAFDAFPVSITFDEFYDGYNIRSGLILSDKLLSLDGQTIMMEGYMAPPLKPELDYFVLTRIKLAFCPFCSTAGDWPDDIALVYMTNQTVTPTTVPIRLVGRLEVGASIDEETGMVSLVRIYATDLEFMG